ncbi:hypothetical protein ACNI65_12120 [Roseateles sp. So40a]|uniref:hypothetical protein n=1 Tax=Roseateles sp. So40a TaxID=3400226 RepID=UPI003A87B68F
MSIPDALTCLAPVLAARRWAIVGSVADRLHRPGACNRALPESADLDLAVWARDLADLIDLRDALARTLRAEVDARLPFRLVSATGLPVDLVPCGPIAQSGLVDWGRPGLRPMSVRGFDEAVETASPRSSIEGRWPVATVPWLIVLRLLAWEASRGRRHQDLVAVERLVATHARRAERLGELSRALRAEGSAQTLAALSALGLSGACWRLSAKSARPGTGRRLRLAGRLIEAFAGVPDPAGFLRL